MKVIFSNGYTIEAEGMIESFIENEGSLLTITSNYDGPLSKLYANINSGNIKTITIVQDDDSRVTINGLETLERVMRNITNAINVSIVLLSKNGITLTSVDNKNTSEEGS